MAKQCLKPPNPDLSEIRIDGGVFYFLKSDIHIHFMQQFTRCYDKAKTNSQTPFLLFITQLFILFVEM